MACFKNIGALRLCCLLLLGMTACGETSKTYKAVHDAGLYMAPQSINALMETFEISDENIGYILQDIATGEIIDAKNLNLSFIPASTAKIFTGYAARKVLGAQFRFETKLCLADNALYLVGGGDPDLKVEDLMAMSVAMAMQKSAKGKVYNAFYYDDSLYPSIDYVNATQPQNAYYNPPVSALTTKDALTFINWRPGNEDGVVELFQSPSLTPTSANVPKDWLLKVDVGNKGQARFPLDNPAEHTAALFQLFSKRNGLDLPPGQRKIAPHGICDYPIVIHQSPPVKNLVAQFFETSSNLQAELLGLAISRKLGAKPKNLKQSVDEMSKWYRGQINVSDWDGFDLFNHSGLSVKARITPNHMASLLAVAKDDLISLMPISGWKGWLKNRLVTPDVSMRVWAKTGAINYAVGLAGYLYPISERPMAFSVFINDLEKRNIHDQMGMGEQIQMGATVSQWNKNAKNTIDSILRYWVAKH